VDDSDDEPEERLPTTFHHADTCLKDLHRVLEERGNTDTESFKFFLMFITIAAASQVTKK
jgi:hypothetical protein